jgi:hypothetical protein
MQSIDGLGLAALIADFNWTRFDRFVDVGGAFGSVLNALLAHNPKAHGGQLITMRRWWKPLCLHNTMDGRMHVQRLGRGVVEYL